MTVTLEQVEIIVYDGSVENHKVYVATLKRRADQAWQEYDRAKQDLANMETRLQYMREAWLKKGCI